MGSLADTLARIALWNAEIQRAIDAYAAEQTGTCACGKKAEEGRTECSGCRRLRYRKEREK